ncbi:MAG: CcoQ/FixQ family Cbb3-type cytochrome c oxidase assembly chaperone [Alphaproteobacteria bacterium]|nr:CcoQ/FixQ family Cbb3-type cytochrome c oxidase assembly chaperone [Alphaproteobacteria bacterium]
MGSVTVFFVGFFLAWAWIAYSPANRARWDEAARLPFEDGEDQ